MKLAEYRALTRKRPPKYRNHKQVVGGIRFDSKREARRWAVLQLLKKAGQITELRRQVAFTIEVNGHHICRYIADFVYHRDGRLVVEDAKGHRTAAYKLKKKLLRAVHGIAIEEV